MELKIRDTEAHEIKTMAKFEEKVFGLNAFSCSDLEGMELFWLVFDKNFIGWMACEEYTRIQGQRSLYVASLAIIPEFQGMRFSELLLNFALCYGRRESFHSVLLHVRESNVRMIKASKRVGFELTKIVSNYYQNPSEDGILMETTLSSIRVSYAATSTRPLVPGFIGIRFGPDADQIYARYVLSQLTGTESTINLPDDNYIVIWVKPGTEDRLIHDMKNFSGIAEARRVREPIR